MQRLHSALARPRQVCSPDQTCYQDYQIGKTVLQSFPELLKLELYSITATILLLHIVAF